MVEEGSWLRPGRLGWRWVTQRAEEAYQGFVISWALAAACAVVDAAGMFFRVVASYYDLFAAASVAHQSLFLE